MRGLIAPQIENVTASERTSYHNCRQANQFRNRRIANASIIAVALSVACMVQHPAGAAVSPAAQWTVEVPTQPFVDAYGESKAKEIHYTNFSFSPNGRLLAITISDIATGDPEQVWLFDTESRKLKLATEKIDKDNVGLHIDSVVWGSSSTVSIQEMRTTWKNQNGNRLQKVHASMGQSVEETIPWPERDAHQYNVVMSPRKHYRFELDSNGPGDARLVDLSQSPERDLFVKPHAWYRLAKWTPDDRYVIFYESHGHGSGSLLAAQTSPTLSTFTIVADGGGELLGLAVSADTPRIAFVVNGGIGIYDLNKRTIVKTISTSVGLGRTLAWSVDDRMAYEADTCGQSSTAEIAGWSTRVRQSMRRVCIVNIFDDRPK